MSHIGKPLIATEAGPTPKQIVWLLVGCVALGAAMGAVLLWVRIATQPPNPGNACERAGRPAWCERVNDGDR